MKLRKAYINKESLLRKIVYTELCYAQNLHK